MRTEVDRLAIDRPGRQDIRTRITGKASIIGAVTIDGADIGLSVDEATKDYLFTVR